MMNTEALSIPSPIHPEKTCVLCKRIAAIRLLDLGGGRGKLGEIVQLQPGTSIACCGSGYNERTAKVFCDGQFYFVFLEDVSSNEAHE